MLTDELIKDLEFAVVMIGKTYPDRAEAISRRLAEYRAAPKVPEGWRPNVLQLSEAITRYELSADNGRPEIGMKNAFLFLLAEAVSATRDVPSDAKEEK